MAGDLKAVFSQAKEDDAGGEEQACWDQEEEEDQEEQPTPLSADPRAEEEKSSGFKFSFFGEDAETGSGEAGGRVSGAT